MEYVAVGLLEKVIERPLGKRELLVMIGIISFGEEGAPSLYELAKRVPMTYNHVCATAAELHERGLIKKDPSISLNARRFPLSNIYIHRDSNKEPTLKKVSDNAEARVEDLHAQSPQKKINLKTHIGEVVGSGEKEPLTPEYQIGTTPQAPEGVWFGFDEFWEMFPRRRRGSRKKARDSWKTHKCAPIAAKIHAHVRTHSKRNFDWLRGFAPMASTYLNQHQWDNELPRVSEEEWRKAGMMPPVDDSLF